MSSENRTGPLPRLADPAAAPNARALVTVALFVPVVIALALWAFAWSAARAAPRDLPLGVAGPASATAALDHQLARHPGVFSVHHYAGRDAAEAAIRDRDVYGAVVASPSGVTLLTASAASPVVAQTLAQMIPKAQVTDLVPASRNDPSGIALGSSVLPLALTGIITGLLSAKAARPGLRMAAGLVVVCSLAGLAGIGIIQGWLGIIAGNPLANAAAIGCTVLAIASVVAGLAGLLGYPGLGLAALVMVLLGNPFSGMLAAPQFLPKPAGTIGQLLPPGAGGNLLRSTAFFHGHGALGHLTVLLAWVAAGMTAVTASALRNRRGRAATIALTASPLPQLSDRSRRA